MRGCRRPQEQRHALDNPSSIKCAESTEFTFGSAGAQRGSALTGGHEGFPLVVWLDRRELVAAVRRRVPGIRLVYLHQHFVKPDMAGGTRSYEFARRLAGRGHDVHVVAGDRTAGASRRTELVDGFSVEWLPVPYDNSMRSRQRIEAFLLFAARASRIARSLRADVVLATSTPLTIVLPALAATVGRRTPMVFEVRDLWPELPIAMGHLGRWPARGAAYGLQRLAYARASRIIALSPGMRDGVVARGVAPETVSVVPNACDRSAFLGREDEGQRLRSELGWLGRRPLAVYAGTYGRINDVRRLVDIASAAQRAGHDTRFLTVGTGAEERLVREAAAAAGVLDDNFFMLPARPKSQMGPLLAAADIALSLFLPLPEMEANSANKFFDALAAGRPVAVNYGGWQAELLERTGAGLRLDRDTVTAAEQLSVALHDPAWVGAARAAARTLAKESFDRDALFEQFEAVLITAAHEA